MAADWDRVARMEAILDESDGAAADMERALEKMDALRDGMTALFQYYGSEDWHADRAADKPAEVKAGVLSEDAVYDLITDVRDAAFDMMELAADILKNRI